MGLGTSIFLIAVGAVLDFAIQVNTARTGVNIHTVGVILMVVGAIGALLSVIFWNSWGGFNRGSTTVATDYDTPRTRRVVEQEVDYR